MNGLAIGIILVICILPSVGEVGSACTVACDLLYGGCLQIVRLIPNFFAREGAIILCELGHAGCLILCE
jgi:hypothetical protein